MPNMAKVHINHETLMIQGRNKCGKNRVLVIHNTFEYAPMYTSEPSISQNQKRWQRSFPFVCNPNIYKFEKTPPYTCSQLAQSTYPCHWFKSCFSSISTWYKFEQRLINIYNIQRRNSKSGQER